MPFLKFARDKRGYENYYLMEPPAGGRRGGKGQPRLLFWFRTPPHVKVGRQPFSDDVRQIIEAQHPGIRFDWARIMATPIPPPDVDHWRERRRAEKAARRAAREVEPDTEAAPGVDTEQMSSHDETEHVADSESAIDGDVARASDAPASTAETPPPSSEMQASGPESRHRRRRRRRGRRGPHDQQRAPGSTGEMSAPDTPPEQGPPSTNEV